MSLIRKTFSGGRYCLFLSVFPHALPLFPHALPVRRSLTSVAYLAQVKKLVNLVGKSFTKGPGTCGIPVRFINGDWTEPNCTGCPLFSNIDTTIVVKTTSNTVTVEAVGKGSSELALEEYRLTAAVVWDSATHSPAATHLTKGHYWFMRRIATDMWEVSDDTNRIVTSSIRLKAYLDQPGRGFFVAVYSNVNADLPGLHDRQAKVRSALAPRANDVVELDAPQGEPKNLVELALQGALVVEGLFEFSHTLTSLRQYLGTQSQQDFDAVTTTLLASKGPADFLLRVSTRNKKVTTYLHAGTSHGGWVGISGGDKDDEGKPTLKYLLDKLITSSPQIASSWRHHQFLTATRFYRRISDACCI